MRTAACACGQLRLEIQGDPQGVYACACLECQRATGSAFAYRARYARARIRVSGEQRAWRRGSDAGRWVEQYFCPVCGTLVYMGGEALPDAVVVSVGCFADPTFAAPARLYHAARRHGWYVTARDIQRVD
ncbi:GFA family protein [Luteimonas salinilitoris]|uniref:GFA family protein n=1 Tax=Luteimonas salinilitoris TaxID=3237697 RepID=A0ABV4HVJ1_9GAMM